MSLRLNDTTTLGLSSSKQIGKGFIEFTAIVLATSSSNNLYPLPDNTTPNFLLSFANNPIISYVLSLLEYNGFHHIIVVVKEKHLEQMHEYISNEYKLYKMDVTNITIRHTSNEELGEVEILRKIHKDIKTDFLVIRSDIITDVSLKELARIHRTQDSSITLVLKRKYLNSKKKYEKNNKNNNDNNNIKNRRRKNSGKSNAITYKSMSHTMISSHFIGTDKIYFNNMKCKNIFNIQRLLYLKNELDLSSNIDNDNNSFDDSSSNNDFNSFININKELLDERPHILLTKTLEKMDIGIFCHWILMYILETNDYISLYEELVPYFIDNQFGISNKESDTNEYLDDENNTNDNDINDDDDVSTVSRTSSSVKPLSRKNSAINIPSLIRKATQRLSMTTNTNKTSSPHANKSSPSKKRSPSHVSIDKTTQLFNTSTFFLSPSINMKGVDYLISASSTSHKTAIIQSLKSPTRISNSSQTNNNIMKSGLNLNELDFDPISSTISLYNSTNNSNSEDTDKKENIIKEQIDNSNSNSSNNNNDDNKIDINPSIDIVRNKSIGLSNTSNLTDEIRVYGYCVKAKYDINNCDSNNIIYRNKTDDKINICQSIINCDKYLISSQLMLRFCNKQLKLLRKRKNNNYNYINDSDSDDYFDDSDTNINNEIYQEKLKFINYINKDRVPLWSNLISSKNQTRDVIKMNKQSHIDNECLICSHGFKIGEKSNIKNSIIGRFVKIGNLCKINNCVILDYVEIFDNVSLINCIISSNAIIKENCVLNNVIVGYKKIVSKNKKRKQQILSTREKNDDEWEDFEFDNTTDNTMIDIN